MGILSRKSYPANPIPEILENSAEIHGKTARTCYIRSAQHIPHPGDPLAPLLPIDRDLGFEVQMRPGVEPSSVRVPRPTCTAPLVLIPHEPVTFDLYMTFHTPASTRVDPRPQPQPKTVARIV